MKCLKIFKIQEFFFYKNRDFFFLFYNVYKENVFTTEIEDGPSI